MDEKKDEKKTHARMQTHLLATTQGAKKGPVIFAVLKTKNSDMKWNQAIPNVHMVIWYILEQRNKKK